MSNIAPRNLFSTAPSPNNGEASSVNEDWLSRALTKKLGPAPSSSSEEESLGSSSSLTIVTWNIWFDWLAWQARLVALLTESLQENPDVLCFQEVTCNVHTCMLQCTFLTERYQPTEPGRLPHGYDASIWIKKDSRKIVNISPAKTIPLGSIYGRRGVLVDLEIMMPQECTTTNRPRRVRVVTTHLESGLGESRRRKLQLETLFDAIPSLSWRGRASHDDDKSWDVAFLVGDFNLDPHENQDENALVESHATDLWRVLRPISEPGFTEDTYQNHMRYTHHGHRHKQVRYDRIVMMKSTEKTSNETVVPQRIQVLGTEPFDDAMTLWPSDHFGVVATVDLH